MKSVFHRLKKIASRNVGRYSPKELEGLKSSVSVVFGLIALFKISQIDIGPCYLFFPVLAICATVGGLELLKVSHDRRTASLMAIFGIIFLVFSVYTAITDPRKPTQDLKAFWEFFATICAFTVWFILIQAIIFFREHQLRLEGAMPSEAQSTPNQQPETVTSPPAAVD